MSHHPHGVKPYGALLFAQNRQRAGEAHARCRATHLKRSGLFGVLGDEALLKLLGRLPADALGRLTCCCKALYCFASHEELWRALTLQEFEGAFSFKESWKATYISKTIPTSRPQGNPPRVEGVYSDLLYQPFICATTPLRQQWLQCDTVERRAGLSVEDFKRQYEDQNRPVILTDVVPRWKAFKKWNRRYLQKAFGSKHVTVGDYSMKFSDYLAYADTNADDMPLYLFDKTFARTAPVLAEDYQVPEYFADDLFSVLGEEHRPDYRWLIMGPKRSGSSFHKDPNSTSAWNAVIRGSKKWVLYPPSVTPPGVHASADGAEVATPVSLIEWFLNFYGETKQYPSIRECVARSGDLLFVPRGWWHMALNLEESIAVTQNYVSPANLPQVLKFLLSGSRELISGCQLEDRLTLHRRFVSALQKEKPQILEAALKSQSAAKRKVSELSQLFQQDAAGSRTTAFRFGFGE